jgi:antitoxin component of MazEF toxin-antitoxin module
VQVFGSSLALTLPAMFVKVNEIEKGSKMNVLYGLDGVLVLSNSEDLETIKRCVEKIMEKLKKDLETSKR